MEDIAFYCVICGQSLCATLDLAGGVGECPTCLSMVPIPPDTCRRHARIRAGPKFFPRSFLSIQIVYRCETCGKAFQADARWQGITRDCPPCAAKRGIAPPPGVSGMLTKVMSAPAPPLRLTADEVAFLTGGGRTDRETSKPGDET